MTDEKLPNNTALKQAVEHRSAPLATPDTANATVFGQALERRDGTPGDPILSEDPGNPFVKDASDSSGGSEPSAVNNNASADDTAPSVAPDAANAFDSTADSETATNQEVMEFGQCNPSEVLLHLTENYDLFHSPDGTCFAEVTVDGHHETLPVKDVRDYLVSEYLRVRGKAPPDNAVRSAISTLNARAKYNGPERVVHVRVAREAGRVFLDLADRERRVIEINAQGWSIVSDAPVWFRHPSGMRPLPMPERGGSIEDLRPFLNLRDQNDFVLVIAYLIAALHPPGPYTVMAVSGVQGSAKSSFSRFVRAIIDPNVSPLREIPRNKRDFFIMAKNNHVIALDNVPRLPDWVSDLLCRLSTGGGLSTRRLRTDDDEMLFDASRPTILNGIEEVVGRPDLADRSICISLEPLANPRPEEELRNDFRRVEPRILGALLDGLAQCLKKLPHVYLSECSRMADFVKIGTACDGTFWSPGTFHAAYRANRDKAIDAAIEADPLASALIDMMNTQSQWVGTATALLNALKKATESFDRNLPKSPNSLSGRLNRLEPILRRHGIEIKKKLRTGHEGHRIISITRQK
jgi:hypothetical protein